MAIRGLPDAALMGIEQEEPMSKTKLIAAEVVDEAADTPRRGRRSIDLSTTAGVLEEIARLYRDARHGRIQVERAAKLVYILNSALKAHELVTIEARINALEATTHEGP